MGPLEASAQGGKTSSPDGKVKYSEYMKLLWHICHNTQNTKSNQNEKALRETQTLRASRSNVETPFPGAQEGQNLISWRWSLPSPIDPVW